MIDILNEFFESDVLLTKHMNNNLEFTVAMVENGYNSSIKKLFIHKIPADSIVLSLDVCTSKMDTLKKDRYSRINPYFKQRNGSGINKRCDLVIFNKDEINDKVNVIIFDLKSADPDFNETAKQIINSEHFVNYVFSLVDSFYNTSCKIDFYKVIGDTRKRKFKTRIEPDLIRKLTAAKSVMARYNIKEIPLKPDGKSRAKVNFNELMA